MCDTCWMVYELVCLCRMRLITELYDHIQIFISIQLHTVLAIFSLHSKSSFCFIVILYGYTSKSFHYSRKNRYDEKRTIQCSVVVGTRKERRTLTWVCVCGAQRKMSYIFIHVSIHNLCHSILAHYPMSELVLVICILSAFAHLYRNDWYCSTTNLAIGWKFRVNSTFFRMLHNNVAIAHWHRCESPDINISSYLSFHVRNESCFSFVV